MRGYRGGAKGVLVDYGVYNFLIASIVLIVMGLLLAFLPERAKARLASGRVIPTGWIALVVGIIMLGVWLQDHL